MNKILDYMYTVRSVNYCHCLELSTKDELELVIDQSYHEFKKFTLKDFLEFWLSMEIIFLDDDCLSIEDNESNENDLYSFNIEGYIIEYFTHSNFKQ